jgi:hypothetical protein
MLYQTVWYNSSSRIKVLIWTKTINQLHTYYLHILSHTSCHEKVYIFCWSLHVCFISVTNRYNVKCSLYQYMSMCVYHVNNGDARQPKLYNLCLILLSVLFMTNTCLNHLERSARLQLRACTLKQTNLHSVTDITNLLCNTYLNHAYDCVVNSFYHKLILFERSICIDWIKFCYIQTLTNI